MATVTGLSFKERFLAFKLLFPEFYHLHHVNWRMKWAKKLKTKNGQICCLGPFRMMRPIYNCTPQIRKSWQPKQSILAKAVACRGKKP